MLYVSNAFSLQMLDLTKSNKVSVVPVDDPKTVVHGRAFTSAVGHADTANLFSGQLGVAVPAQRVNVKLTAADTLLVGQYVGPRLPEGATTLPEGARIIWLLVTVLQWGRGVCRRQGGYSDAAVWDMWRRGVETE